MEQKALNLYIESMFVLSTNPQLSSPLENSVMFTTVDGYSSASMDAKKGWLINKQVDQRLDTHLYPGYMYNADHVR